MPTSKRGTGNCRLFYAWVTFVVINGSAIAALSLTFAKYFAFIVPVGKRGVLAVDKIAASSCPAADAVQTVLPFGGIFISVMIALSALGTVGICLYSVPRIFFALANDGLFFRSFTAIHGRFRTPANAILFQTAWSIFLLLFWGTFANIITYLVFTDVLFMALVGTSVILLRKTRKDLDRPYKTLGYPVTPLVFVLISFFFLVNTLIHKPAQAYAAIVCLLLGLPFYFYFRKKRQIT